MKLSIKVLFTFSLLHLAGCSSGNDEKIIEASGNIEATNVTVSSQVTGRILSLLREEGETINAGDTIMIIDHESLEYQLQQAEASSDAASAQLSLLRVGARQEDIRQAEEAAKQAEINRDLAKRDMERLQPLYDSGSITKKQIDDASSRFNLTEAQLTSSKENLKKNKRLRTPAGYSPG